VQNATDAVNIYNKLPSSIQGATSAALGLTAIIGGGAWFGSKVIRSVADTRAALSDLGFTAGRTGGTLSFVAKRAAGIAVAAAAVTALGNALAKANGAVLNSSDVGRNLEALSKGGASETLKRITDDLTILGQTSTKAAEPIRETFTAFGLFGNTPLDNAQQNIEGIDQALAGLVESGNAKMAEQAFQQIADASGRSTSELLDSFDAYDTALFNAGKTSSFATTLFGKVNDALDAGSKAAGRAAGKQQNLADKQHKVSAALKEQRKAVAEASQQWLGLGDGLNKAKVSLDDWIKHFAKQADALRNFRINAQAAAKKGLDEGLIASLQAAGPEGALRMKQLADATKEQIARANEGFRSGKREADNLTAAINRITSPKPVHVSVDAGGAMSLLQRLQDFQFRDKYIKVHTLRSGGGEPDYQHGTGFSSGGYTGNYPRSQAVGVVHGGEFVLDAVATARAGVENLYAMQRQLRGYATGGFVGVPATSVRTSSTHTERIIERLPAGRVMANIEGVGDVLLRFTQEVADERIYAHQAQR
jgi:hypothetical protein